MKNLKKIFDNNLFLIVGIGLVAGTLSFMAVKAYTQKSNNQSGMKQCADICVALTSDGIKPDSLAVKVGDFVQFNTKDGKTHNISLGAGKDGHDSHSSNHEHTGDYSSGDFGENEAWRVQFKKAGTYRLHDHYNPKLEVLVVVYEPGAVDKIQ